MTTFAAVDFDADIYAKHRPTYPDSLYEDVIKYTGPSVRSIVDVGCGPGLSTWPWTRLSPATEILGIDPSKNMVNIANQLSRTVPIEGLTADKKLSFAQASAEDLVRLIPEGSVDLITVAQAAHWFDMEKVFSQFEAILKPGGAFAIWGYGEMFFEEYPSLSQIFNEYATGTMGPYWEQPGRSRVDKLLYPIKFPTESTSWDSDSFLRVIYDGGHNELASEELAAKGRESVRIKHVPVTMKRTWPLKDIEPYLNTWSSLHTYRKQHGTVPGAANDPVSILIEKLEMALTKETKKPLSQVFNLPLKTAFKVGLLLGKRKS